MDKRSITSTELAAFARQLWEQERAPGTIEKYIRDVSAASARLRGAEVTRDGAAAWRDSLLERGYAPVTVNSMVAAVNQFFTFLGWEDCKIKSLKIQRRLFRDDRRELTREEYQRLLDAAHGLGRERLALLLETICSTGVRVSEVKYITVEAANSGKAEIPLRGKLRTILLPGRLCRKLKKYAKAQKTASGEIFRTRSGKGLSRRQIWGEMKRLCKAAGVAPSKVFTHNLRHLFARTFYKVCRDVVILKSPYLKCGEGNSVSGYMRYIGIRERGELLPDNRPPTRKQEQLIRKLVKDFPSSKKLDEYFDYETKPTKAHASAFIARALEENWPEIQQSEGYMKYIATRPRAERLGDHGLFDDEDAVDLEQAMRELDQYTGNVWTHIISLKREDAARLGYDNAKAWMNLLRANRNDIAAAMNIPPNHFRWYASYHDEGDHPHVHIMAWSTVPGEAYHPRSGTVPVRQADHRGHSGILHRSQEKRQAASHRALWRGPVRPDHPGHPHHSPRRTEQGSGGETDLPQPCGQL